MSCLKWLLPLGAILVAGSALSANEEEDADFAAGQWKERAVTFPAKAQEESWMPFYVSAATDNLFAIDAGSVSVGEDGVVRYALRVQTAGGARNVSFEGMRCESREWRLYATGRLDGSWSPSRMRDWRRIVDVPQNRQHAALFFDYFCPGGVIVRTRQEALDALKQGGHSSFGKSVN